MSRLLPIPTMPRQLGAGVLLAALCLAGCGQKGPLYLPDNNASAVPAEGESASTTIDPN
jgi:predicted small lipoprotein YifL